MFEATDRESFRDEHLLLRNAGEYTTRLLKAAKKQPSTGRT
jgi:hypothetical protein